jgi:acyl carrier protein
VAGATSSPFHLDNRSGQGKRTRRLTALLDRLQEQPGGTRYERPKDGRPAQVLHRRTQRVYPTDGAIGKSRTMGEGVDRQIRAELTEFIVENYLFGDVTQAPADEDELVEEGIIDSTGILELIEFLEDRFGIEVSEAETVPQNLGSISGLTQYVMSKLPVRQPAL